MKLTLEHHADKDELFTQAAWDTQIGKTVPMYTRNGCFEAELVIADVVAEGLTVLLTFDLPDDAGFQVGDYLSYDKSSIGFSA